MARSRPPAAVLLLLALIHVVPSRADDGCDLLTDTIRENVYFAANGLFARSGTDGGYRNGTGAVGSVAAGLQVCANTRAAVTRAFSETLDAMDMSISWGDAVPGDECFSPDFLACIPREHPLVPGMSPQQLAFVNHAWRAVRDAVTLHMPFGTVHGVSRFTEASLGLALSSSLDSSRAALAWTAVVP